MKKFAALFLALMMLVSMVAIAETAAPEIKIGQIQYAAHGTKCFAVMTVAVQGDKIVAAYIDEYQVGAGMVGVPNSENGFGGFADGMVLYSKRVNNDAYSAKMAGAGSTIALVDNYTAIENFVVGMTIAELEGVIAGFNNEKTAAVDAVSSCTLQDTLGYLQGLLAAAMSAQ